LGHFGGYTRLCGTIRSLLSDPKSVQSHSFRLDATDLQHAKAKEVKVSFARKSTSIAAKNLFSQGGMIAFKKSGKNDGFEAQVQEKIFGLLGQGRADIKKGIAKLLKETNLFDVSDEDIEDCTVIANVNGKQKTIYMLQSGHFATKFPLDVSLNADGHPEYDKTKTAMIELWRDEIIARREDV
jgi:hypothetical protein